MRFYLRGSMALPLEKNYRAFTQKDEIIANFQESLHYAKRIQEALMLKEKHLLRILPDSFLYYKPKDIVSGDFYWFTRTNDFALFVIADCTGHGIPGALMSIMGINLLNQIILEEQQFDPSLILQRLDHKVKKGFSYSKDLIDEITSWDGMDISICRINFFESTITYAGAFQEIFIIQNGQLETHKGSRYPIGGLNLESNRTYDNQTLSYRKGDKLYMFTDGYKDQIGFTSQKRLMVGELKNKLTEIHRLPMAEQMQTLHNTHLSWKKTNAQTDDMTGIGLTL